MTTEQREALSKKIIGAAIEVHRELGPGLLESVYEACLIEELKSRGVKCRSQVFLPVHYKGKRIEGKNFRIDLLVENEIVVELKCVDSFVPIHSMQLATHLKLSNRRLGLLFNFKTVLMKHGIKRVINGYDE